jgi:hypothetical protein
MPQRVPILKTCSPTEDFFACRWQSSACRDGSHLVHREPHAPFQYRGFFGWVLLCLTFAGECSSAEVQLGWDPVDDPRVSRYQVHFGQASRTYTEWVDTTQSSVVIGGYAVGQAHYFAVRACTQDGLSCSTFSDEVIAYIETDGSVVPVQPCRACLPNAGGWRLIFE